MKFEINEYHRNISDNDLLQDLHRVSKQINMPTVSQRVYIEKGKYGVKTFFKRFGSWNNALIKAGLQIGSIKNISDIELFNNLEAVWVKLGRQPKYSEINSSSISKFSTKPYEKRFGTYRKALEAFIEFVNSDNEQECGEETKENVDENLQTYTCNIHKTKRDINLRLRFRIMRRDNFKCCICGASPAKNHKVELHIDHIIPWSKGGETEINNLQTLCSKCNLGKSDLDM